MNLPKIYTEETWKKGGSVKEHKKFIGKPQISWSQIESWRKAKGFSGMSGKKEYILKYFLGVDVAPAWLDAFGQFGSQVEDYICFRKCTEVFSPHELKVLNTIKPLGLFQQEVVVDLDDFVVLGYIDDMSKPKKKQTTIRDYKTKSQGGKKDLHDPDKLQLDLYIGGLHQRGLTVTSAEYIIIERLGGGEAMRGGGRRVLLVGDKVWNESYTFSQETINRAFKIARESANEISNYYTVFKKLQ